MHIFDPESGFIMRTTVMKISGQALRSNTMCIRESIPEQVKMMCVVKANAYGHGSVETARIMEQSGADAFAVAISEEAVQLRNAGITLPILVLGGGSDESLVEAVQADAAQAVYTVHMLDVLQDAAEKLGRKAKAHLKIDTGMSRIGAKGMDKLKELIQYWQENCPDVEMEGIFTHFCAADEDEAFTDLQNSRFMEAVDYVKAQGFDPIAHAAATSAMMKEKYQHDMVRAGVGLYGTLLPELEGRLQYAQKLTCYPVRIDEIEKGDTVGYGRTFTAEKPMRVMTIPVGYGDGYPRILSNKADVLVCGKRARIIGRVCMDMIMADVTDIPEARPESEVVLMGRQGSERITPDELAEKAQTIPYEIMLGFSPRVRYVHENMPLGE